MARPPRDIGTPLRSAGNHWMLSAFPDLIRAPAQEEHQ
jgi:hypothetical protein